MKTIDMRTTVKGDVLVFRNGGESEVSDVLVSTVTPNVGVIFKDSQIRTYYTRVGKVWLTDEEGLSPFDVVGIEKPIFDFSKAEFGMAFNGEDEEDIYLFCGESAMRDVIIFKTKDKKISFLTWEFYKKLKRFPEGDYKES